MATIPNGQKILTSAPEVNTMYGGPASLQALNTWYTMEDISNTVKPCKVYTALLTQSGSEDLQTFTWEYLQPIPEFPILLAGVTYYIDSNQSNTDFTIAGSPNNDGGTSFVANGTQPNWQPPFEIESNYIQIEWNTGAPVVTVLENTIGDIYWTYVATGVYAGNLLGSFPLYKTIGFSNIWTSTGTDNYITFDFLSFPGEKLILTSAALNSPDIYSDDKLNKSMIEIRVYN